MESSGTVVMARPGGIRELLAIALPMVISSACETVMMFTDRLFLAKVSPELMSAAMAGGLTCFMLTTFFVGVTGYSNALVAQYFGAGMRGKCAIVATQAFIVSVFAYPVILAMLPIGEKLFIFTGVSETQIVPQMVYFRIVMYGTVIALLRNSLSSFFCGIGKTRIVMISAFVSMIVNVGANYILIFGKLGFPALGIEGAAIGTIIGSVAGLGVLSARYFGGYIRSQYGVISAFRFDLEVMKKLFKFGYPSGVEFFLNMLAFNLLVLMFHSYGPEVAASVTIAFNWDMLSFIPLVGVHIGVMSLVGRYMGARDPDTAHGATMSGLKFALIYTVFSFVAFFVFPGYLVSMFEPSIAEEVEYFRAEIFPLAKFMVRFITVYVFADAISIVYSGALKGAGDTFWTMVISVIMHWVLAGTAFFMIQIVEASPRASWAVTILMILLIGIMFYFRYRTGKWRNIKVVE